MSDNESSRCSCSDCAESGEEEVGSEGGFVDEPSPPVSAAETDSGDELPPVSRESTPASKASSKRRSSVVSTPRSEMDSSEEGSSASSPRSGALSPQSGAESDQSGASTPLSGSSSVGSRSGSSTPRSGYSTPRSDASSSRSGESSPLSGASSRASSASSGSPPDGARSLRNRSGGQPKPRSKKKASASPSPNAGASECSTPNSWKGKSSSSSRDSSPASKPSSSHSREPSPASKPSSSHSREPSPESMEEPSSGSVKSPPKSKESSPGYVPRSRRSEEVTTNTSKSAPEKILPSRPRPKGPVSPVSNEVEALLSQASRLLEEHENSRSIPCVNLSNTGSSIVGMNPSLPSGYQPVDSSQSQFSLSQASSVAPSSLLQQSPIIVPSSSASAKRPVRRRRQKHDPEAQVEQVLSRRIYRGKLQYWIKWEDHPAACNSWEPEDSLKNCDELLKEFNKGFLEKKKNSMKGPGRGYTKAILGITRKRAKNPDSDSDDDDDGDAQKDKYVTASSQEDNSQPPPSKRPALDPDFEEEEL